MLSKFDDYPIHQTSLPIAQPATGDRNAYDRYWFNGYQDDGEFYFGIGARAVPEPRHPRLRPEHRARRRAARVPRLAPRAPRAHRPPHRAVRDRRAGADAPHPGHDRRQRHRHRGRPHLHRPHRVCGRGPPDPFPRPPPDHGRDPLRAVRHVGGRDPLRRQDRADRCRAGLRHQGPQLGRAGCRHPRPGPRAHAAGLDAGLLPVGAVALGRSLHALRCVRGRARQPVALRRRGAPGLRLTCRHPRRRGPRHRDARRGRARPRLPPRDPARRPRCASRSCTPTVPERTSTSSRSSASA